MTGAIIALVFRCKVTGGNLRETSEESACPWATETEVAELLDEAYAVRVVDAMHDTWPPAVRQHDGVRLL